MKKRVIFLLIAAFAVLAAGCSSGGSYVITVGDIHPWENGISLSATVIDSAGSTVAEIGDNEAVTVNTGGTYKVQVEGNNHKGCFDLYWE